MYPDWPEFPSDLVPLPLCDGPKLAPFDFHGPQQIEFLELLGEGVHSFVVKVAIAGQIYALKIFRFIFNDDWIGPAEVTHDDDREALGAFYEYSEPFNCECRAFGRLKETGHEDLAIGCFGYVLLDEAHERALDEKMQSKNYNALGISTEIEARGLFPGLRSGRPPPIRAIVKELGKSDLWELRAADMRRLLRTTVQLHQLGIVNHDLRDDQLINHRLSDFSTTMTVPHFILNPELNPRLTPAAWAAMEYETFKWCINDYWQFDVMVDDYNATKQKQFQVFAIPSRSDRRFRRTQHDLRRTSRRERVYTLVDPRPYDWRASGDVTRGGASPDREKTDSDDAGENLGGVPKKPKRKRLDPFPARWFLDCSAEVAEDLQRRTDFGRISLEWVYMDGLLFPRKFDGVHGRPADYLDL